MTTVPHQCQACVAAAMSAPPKSYDKVVMADHLARLAAQQGGAA
jgi:hypothetical protein